MVVVAASEWNSAADAEAAMTPRARMATRARPVALECESSLSPSVGEPVQPAMPPPVFPRSVLVVYALARTLTQFRTRC
jgi:hypothetical protein